MPRHLLRGHLACRPGTPVAPKDTPSAVEMKTLHPWHCQPPAPDAGHHHCGLSVGIPKTVKTLNPPSASLVIASAKAIGSSPCHAWLTAGVMDWFCEKQLVLEPASPRVWPSRNPDATPSEWSAVDVWIGMCSPSIKMSVRCPRQEI